MKKILFLLIGLVLSCSMRAQSDITIGLFMPEDEINEVRPDTYQLLQTKLEKMLAASSVSAYGGDFVMYPTVNIIDEKLIEGGIKNFYKLKIELTLNVVNLTSNTLFSSESWLLSGTSERFKNDAVKAAFAQLRGNDPRFQSFIMLTKNRISEYYVANKHAILSKASSLASTGHYEEAIAILLGYPLQVSGFDEAQSLMYKIYMQHINANAARIVNEARAAFATKDYEQAVNLAAQIDPQSSYYNEAKSLINQVRSTINREQAAEHQREMRALEIAASVEKSRINAAASVARAYYRRRVVNYNYCVTNNFVRIY